MPEPLTLNTPLIISPASSNFTISTMRETDVENFLKATLPKCGIRVEQGEVFYDPQSDNIVGDAKKHLAITSAFNITLKYYNALEKHLKDNPSLSALDLSDFDSLPQNLKTELKETIETMFQPRYPISEAAQNKWDFRFIIPTVIYDNDQNPIGRATITLSRFNNQKYNIPGSNQYRIDLGWQIFPSKIGSIDLNELASTLTSFASSVLPTIAIFTSDPKEKETIRNIGYSLVDTKFIKRFPLMDLKSLFPVAITTKIALATYLLNPNRAIQNDVVTSGSSALISAINDNLALRGIPNIPSSVISDLHIN